VPTHAESGIVLRCWDFSETSQTVSIVTRGLGVVRGLAKGARRPKARFSGGFEPLTRGQLVFITKPSTELATVTEWDLEEIYHHTRTELRAHLAALYFADLTHHALSAEDPHPRLFDALDACLDALADPGRIDAAALVYQFVLLAETGYEPRLDDPSDADAHAGSAGQAAVLGFDAIRGEVVADPGPGASHGQAGEAAGGAASVNAARIFRVRASTIDVLRVVAASTAGARGATRASRDGADAHHLAESRNHASPPSLDAPATEQPTSAKASQTSADESLGSNADVAAERWRHALGIVADAADTETLRRAAALLATVIRVLLDRELPTRAPFFDRT
jgi:hypothetical protein